MKSGKWRRKTILPLLLSAIMVFEPVGSVATVYAEETEPVAEATDLEDDSPIDEEGGDLPDHSEETDQSGDNDTGDKNEDKDSDGEDNAPETEEPADKKEELPENPPEENEEEIGKGEEENLPEGETPEEEVPEEGLPEEGEETEEVPNEEDTVSGNDLEEEEQEEEKFPGLPDGYELNSAQRNEKRLLADMAGEVNEADEGILYVEREVMTTADSQEEAEMIAEAYGAEIESFENGLLVMTLGEEATVSDAIQAAASSRTLLPAVWPNYYRYAHVEEADPSDVIEIEETEYEENAAEVNLEEGDVLTEEAYGYAIASYSDPDLLPSSSRYQWQHIAVGSPYAWKAGYTGAGVSVAVLDSGISAHADLSIAKSVDETNTDTNDGAGHGTHVAGIIGAKSNTIGGAGIAPDATLYNIKVLDNGGRGSDDMIWHGLDQAIKWNADIINMSLGGPGYNKLLEDKIAQAYNKGIAVFVSVGNDGISCTNYPAGYKNVICVAATDTNNVRADFSTYGSWVDLSAPGVNIYSTYKNGDYAALSGTSMACPVASGEAAVLLGSHANLKNMPKGKAKVDALEKLMKSNAVRASGSGMGSGITSLTKAFKLATAVAKPQAPEIRIVPNKNGKQQDVTVTIIAPMGVTVYYTTNGKTPAFKNGELDTVSEAQEYSAPFVINDSAKGTVKAIAVNENGVASAVKSASYTLKPYVTSVEISGKDQATKIAKGKSVQLSATVAPAYATNKQIRWEIENAEAAQNAGVTINQKNGKVTAAKNATTGKSYKVKAIAADRGTVMDTCTIEVIDTVKIGAAKFKARSVTLAVPKDASYDLVKDGNFVATQNDKAKTPVPASEFKWTSNNTQVATVNQAGIVTPHKAGKVTITALANDSSGKKATCTVTVTQLAEKVEISGPATVSVGKGVTFKAEVTPKDTTDKKVTWELYKNGVLVNAKQAGVSINTSGKVTAAQNAKTGDYTVKAVSKDKGKVASAEAKIRVVSGSIDKFTFSNKNDSKVTLFRKKAVGTTKIQQDITVRITNKGEANLDAYTVTSSNKGIADATAVRTGNNIKITIKATGKAAGKTNITVASTDGSNKKITCAVNVVNPVSKIHIASNTITASYGNPKVDMCVVQGKSIQLKATLENEYGKASNSNVDWSINAPAWSGVTINKSGKISASKTAPLKDSSGAFCVWTVTAKAKDGSDVKAYYRVMAVPAATVVRVPTLEPGRGYKGISLPYLPDVNGRQQFWSTAPIIYEDVYGGYVEATSSNKKVVEVTVVAQNGNRYLYISPHGKGTATITVKATDGSNKKASYLVKVQ